jgi:hypothetical protein
VQINLDDLRDHYRSLADDELLTIERADLTDAAQRCYDQEISRRGLHNHQEPKPVPEFEKDSEPLDTDADPDWIKDAAIACSYTNVPGGTAASDAEHARVVLQEAGIPCQISVTEDDPNNADGSKFPEFQVMVPGALNLKATSVLDKEIFNEGLETEWRTHFEALTDAQLRALAPDVICAGLADRIARLQRAYHDELARRAMGSSGRPR